MKKDIQLRLAHKRPYERIERSPEEQLDLLIVVDQILTGFDSKWLNVLYLDKVLRYESIIQAFSRTNRLFGPEKPFGSIKYYRVPYTMEQNIHAAVKLYSGDKPKHHPNGITREDAETQKSENLIRQDFTAEEPNKSGSEILRKYNVRTGSCTQRRSLTVSTARPLGWRWTTI